jgi:hypothetical protein
MREQSTKVGQLCIEGEGAMRACPCPPWKKEGQWVLLPSMEEGGALGASALHGRRRGNGCPCPATVHRSASEAMHSVMRVKMGLVMGVMGVWKVGRGGEGGE